MDILQLVDRLEEIVSESPSLPFTRNRIVDEDRLFDLIDQMRVAIPEEVKKARQQLAQRDRILAQAKEEAERTIALAREKQADMLAKDAIVQAARAQAEEILRQAEADAEVTRREADQYVMDVLATLEEYLQRYLTQVRNGILTLQKESEPEPAPPPSEPAT